MRLLPIIISLSFSQQAFSSDWLELNNLPNSTEYPTWVQSAYSDMLMCYRVQHPIYTSTSVIGLLSRTFMLLSLQKSSFLQIRLRFQKTSTCS